MTTRVLIVVPHIVDGMKVVVETQHGDKTIEHEMKRGHGFLELSLYDTCSVNSIKEVKDE